MGILGRDAAIVVLLIGCGGRVDAGDSTRDGSDSSRGAGGRESEDAAGGRHPTADTPGRGASSGGSSNSGGRIDGGGALPGSGGTASGGALATGGALPTGGTSSGGTADTGGSGGNASSWPDFGSIENCETLSTTPGEFNACGTVKGLEFTPGGEFLIAAFDAPPPNVHVWRMGDGARVRDLPGANEGALCTALSHDGRYLAVGGRRGPRDEPIARVYDLSTYEEAFTIDGPSGITEMAFSSDGSLLATNDDPSSAWNVPDGSLYATFPETSFFKMQFSPMGGRSLVTRDHDGQLVLDVATKEERLVVAAEEVDVLSYSPDGRSLVAVTWTGKVQLRVPDGGTILHEAPIPTGGEGYNRIEWLSAERFVVIEWGKDATFWEIESGATLSHLSTHLDGWLEATAGSPDGRVLAIGVARADVENVQHGIVFITP